MPERERLTKIENTHTNTYTFRITRLRLHTENKTALVVPCPALPMTKRNIKITSGSGRQTTPNHFALRTTTKAKTKKKEGK